jgi:polyhydroxyalkanoate synthase subunit PhaC
MDAETQPSEPGTVMLTFMDQVRSVAGCALDSLGLGASETPYRIIAEPRGARLRAYQPAGRESGPALLIIASPIKRPYIWDLLPAVSVVRRCLARNLAVYLLEWRAPRADENDLGLAHYANQAPAAAVEAVFAERGRCSVILAGHSIGGTLAAVFAALNPGLVAALLLIDAPLSFGCEGGPLVRAVGAAPPARHIRTLWGGPVPGSFLSYAGTAAAPEVFLGQRSTDLVACLFDGRAMATHLRVERWALDELSMPGQLFEDLVERLYREDSLSKGHLDIGGQRARLDRLRCHVLAIVNPHGVVVPPASMLRALAEMRYARVQVLSYEKGIGSGLQHLGPMIAPRAHEHLWPRILDCLGAPAM